MTIHPSDSYVRKGFYIVKDAEAELERMRCMQQKAVNYPDDKSLPRCVGAMHVFDGPGGGALPFGGFDLYCEYARDHVGYCKDITGLSFVTDTVTIGGNVRTRGRVVHWNGASYDDVLRLERDLAGA